ncbi:winged helix-turn-helix domain-containing protein [Aliikangiella coralliicola]|uniref:OmpR/PhoB-type domain-containing protein n=1 Tax=Aliikangiella coralliicola TaxID=2592383 RepID=A0A545U8M4_9GAMM|nr:winged helix-turn-helix domain-containing protein [Aliikangiella coralliicola]TQV85816.1 hypothetical protein FLL46_17985 [Aliikangiella coralliicola]
MIHIYFADKQLDTEKGILYDLSENSETKLPRKTTLVLCHLLQNSGKTIPKKELIDTVWNGNEYVGDQGVSNALWRIRKALGEESTKPVFLETIPKVGYKWLVPPVSSEPENPPSQIAGRKRLYASGVVMTGLFLLAIVVWKLIQHTDNIPTHSDFKVHSVSSNYGIERYPAVSPNGNQLLFSWRKETGKANIFLKDLNSEQTPIQLTDDLYQDLKPVWSPDASHFAYLRQSISSSECQLMLYNLQNREQTELASCTITEIGEASLSWSPDGKFIAYNSNDNTISIINPNLNEPNSRKSIPLVVNTGIFTDVFPTWSIDSQTVFFIRQNAIDNPEVFQVYLENKEVHQVTQSLAKKLVRVDSLTMASDGVILLSGLDRIDHNVLLYQLIVESGNFKPVKQPNTKLKDLTFDPTYNRLYYAKPYHTSHLGDIDLNAPSVVTKVSPYQPTFSVDVQPSYCKETDTIIFVSNSSGNQELWQIKNNQLEQLTYFGENSVVFSPACSKSGRYIAFSGYVPKPDSTKFNRQFHLYVYDIKLNTTIELTKDENFEPVSPSWNFDDSEVISGQLDIQGSASLWSNEFRQDGENKNLNLPFLNTKSGPNGTFLFTANANGEIWKVALNDFSKRQLVVEDMDEADWGNWDIDGSSLIYLKRTDNTNVMYDQIFQLNLNDGKTKLIAQLPFGTIRNQNSFAVNSERQRLVVAYFSKRVSSIEYIELE